MLTNLNQPNRMKKLLFILALLAMVVLPNVAPAHEPGEHRHFSDGVALVSLEERPSRGGEGTGIAALPAEKEATLASGDLRCGQQMPPPARKFQLLKDPIQRTKSVASHDRKSRVSTRRLVFAVDCPPDFSEASRQNKVDGICGVTLTERSCHL